MKQFNFRLQKVLEVREREEQDAIKALSQAKQVVLDARSTLLQLETIKADIITGLGTLRRAGALDPNEQIAYQTYLVQVKEKIALQETKIVELQATEHDRRLELVEAARERMAIENLKAKAKTEYDYETLKDEQIEADDLTSARHIHRQRAA
jgi:flagellar FliJ protein